MLEQLKRHVRTPCLRAFAITAVGCLMTSCGPPDLSEIGTTDSYALFRFELVNQASAPVRVRYEMDGGKSPIRDLGSGERHTDTILTGFGVQDTSHDNYFVGRFEGIYFYAPGAAIPYLGYTYRGRICYYARWRDLDIGYDMLCLYDTSDGAREERFVASPDRPFYLEKDEEDHDLARLVITFVPSVEEFSEMPDPTADFDFEVVNAASAGVGVQIVVGVARFREPIGGGVSDWSGILRLGDGERHLFRMGVYGGEDSSADNHYAGLREIYFYAPGADIPYVVYLPKGDSCSRFHAYFGRDARCVPYEDDRLFVRSADRPFYLERDEENHDLARLVITFVPSAATFSASGGIP